MKQQVCAVKPSALRKLRLRSLFPIKDFHHVEDKAPFCKTHLRKLWVARYGQNAMGRREGGLTKQRMDDLGLGGVLRLAGVAHILC